MPAKITCRAGQSLAATIATASTIVIVVSHILVVIRSLPFQEVVHPFPQVAETNVYCDIYNNQQYKLQHNFHKGSLPF